MKVGIWTARLCVAVLVVAVLSNWLGDSQQDKTTQSAGAEPHPIALLGSVGSVDGLAKVAPTAPQAFASGGELTRQKTFAYKSALQSMGLNPTMIAATESDVQLKRRQGASEDDIYRLRAAAYSAEKATLLAEMERAETGWHIRVQSYLAEKSRLSNNNNDAAISADQSIALQQLRNARFTAEEQKLLIANEPSPGPRLILEPDTVSP